MNTNKFAIDYTDTNDIADETVDLENEYDMESVMGLIEQLRTQFRTIKAVRPTCETIENLLLVTGHNSWTDFQKQFKDELNEYFTDNSTAQDIDVDRSMLIRAEKHRDMIAAQIKKIEESVKAYETHHKQLNTKLSVAELDAAATEGMEWDPETHKKHVTATKLAAHCKQQLKQMETKNPLNQLKQLYLNLRHAEGRMRFAEMATQGNFRVLVNTGDAKEDARLYQKVGESCIWEINNLLDEETKIEAQMANERHSSADLGIARFTNAPFEDTSGGIFDRAIDRLHETREKLEDRFATYSACQYGYELAAQAFVPKHDREWFPEWMELSQALRQARSRKQTASINRARSQLEAARGLAAR